MSANDSDQTFPKTGEILRRRRDGERFEVLPFGLNYPYERLPASNPMLVLRSVTTGDWYVLEPEVVVSDMEQEGPRNAE